MSLVVLSLAFGLCEVHLSLVFTCLTVFYLLDCGIETSCGPCSALSAAPAPFLLYLVHHACEQFGPGTLPCTGFPSE